MSTIKELLADIIKKEGGFVNLASDKGGPTNLGITQETLSHYLGKNASIEDVQDLTIEVACEIYEKNYYYGPHIDKLPQSIQPVVLDMAVNSGSRQAIKTLQKVINDAKIVPCEVDGVCGPGTCRAAMLTCQSIGKDLINDIVDARLRFYKQIAGNNPSQLVFLRGWEKRAESFRV